MSNDVTRLRLLCTGAVQGVGFRPAVYRLAVEMHLAGWVINGPDGVTIEIEGNDARCQEFVRRFPQELPPLARLETFASSTIEIQAETAFKVGESLQGKRTHALVPADTRICTACQAEMQNPADRRYQYPFTVCTNCGPRFSLVNSLPYDREKTSMACFPLCDDCQAEYENPADRRFHAEPVCCPKCGPEIWAVDAEGSSCGKNEIALQAARTALQQGKIVALKGLGGFQLACDASSPSACMLLRARKHRPSKPFAIMAKDLVSARGFVHLDHESSQLLSSPRSPIVLAAKRSAGKLSQAPGSPQELHPKAICKAVAPGIHDLGVMLPTTPLHLELFRGLGLSALVMTSANASEEPICRGNREAVQRLSDLADLFLLHNRDVVRRVDDSVVRNSNDGLIMLRRSRGYVPDPIGLPVTTPEPLLAMGGHLQTTVCFGVENDAFLSQHIGDLDTVGARAFHREVIQGLAEFLQLEAGAIVVDPHPDYPSKHMGVALAQKLGVEIIEVQHHLAHLAATAAEHGQFPQADQTMAGIALDGTGWGPDQSAWGGEFMRFDGQLRWSRIAHLQPLPLVGGEAAVREPWRILVAALSQHGLNHRLAELPFAQEIPQSQWQTIAQLSRSSHWPGSSGAGRLFEAAGTLLGVGAKNSFEGECAMRLEALAEQASSLPEAWTLDNGFSSVALLAEAARRFLGGESAANVAAGFHVTFSRMLAQLARQCFGQELNTLALGGGCLVNRILRTTLKTELRAVGYQALLPGKLPPGDGGLSYGQAVIGSIALARHTRPQMIDPHPCA